MRLVTNEPSQFGVISFGEEAQGIFAFGQFACGVFAFGQIAIGVIAVGQVSFSIVGLGQVGGAVTWFAGMGGIAGRGLCLRLIPGLDPPRIPPKEVALAAVEHGAEQGYVRVKLVSTPSGAALTGHGQTMPIKLTPKMVWALTKAQQSGMKEAYAELKREGSFLVCRRAMEIPGARSASPHTGLNVLRFAALVGVATLWTSIFFHYVVAAAR